MARERIVWNNLGQALGNQLRRCPGDAFRGPRANRAAITTSFKMLEPASGRLQSPPLRSRMRYTARGVVK